jgi:hypothetical protein
LDALSPMERGVVEGFLVRWRGIMGTERELDLPGRSGKVVLAQALARLAGAS